MIVLAANASRTGPLESCLSTCSDSSLPAPDQVRVLDLNMLHGFPRFEKLAERVELISSEILRLKPDIICLQEVPWTLQTKSVVKDLSTQTQMNYVYSPANGNRRAILFAEGVAILSRFPIENAEYVELSPRAGLFEHRIALHATIGASNFQIHVICTHLSHRDPAINAGQVGSLVETLDSIPDGPAILAGDFNTEEDTQQIEQLTEEWTDIYRTQHPRDLGLTCCIDTFKGPSDEFPNLRIDYLFVRPSSDHEFQIIRSELVFDHSYPTPDGPLWASDHYGVWADIELIQKH